MMCGCVRLRNRKRLTEYILVFMRLFICKKQSTHTNVSHRLNLTSHTQTFCTDDFQRGVCGFNKQGAWLNRVVGKLVIWSERRRHQPGILSRNKGETHLLITRACVLNRMPKLERRKKHCVEVHTTQHCSAIQTKI